MPPKKPSTFDTLYAVDVKEDIEDKGGFSYLSWPFAVRELRKVDPEAYWEVHTFTVPYSAELTVDAPYMVTPVGFFVSVSVTVAGVTLNQVHPVLDNRHNTIKVPNAFDINASIQRCLVKAIALHGLGLHIYAGEDLPETATKRAPKKPAGRPKPQAKPPVDLDEKDPFFEGPVTLPAGAGNTINESMLAAKDFVELNSIYQTIPDKGKQAHMDAYMTAAARLKGEGDAG